MSVFVVGSGCGRLRTREDNVSEKINIFVFVFVFVKEDAKSIPAVGKCELID